MRRGDTVFENAVYLSRCCAWLLTAPERRQGCPNSCLGAVGLQNTTKLCHRCQQKMWTRTCRSGMLGLVGGQEHQIYHPTAAIVRRLRYWLLLRFLPVCPPPCPTKYRLWTRICPHNCAFDCLCFQTVKSDHSVIQSD